MNTNMLVERYVLAKHIRNMTPLSPTSSFHNKLKNHSRYLDHKPNRRLDDLIHTLLKFECDMFLSQQHKQVHMHTYIVLVCLPIADKGDENPS